MIPPGAFKCIISYCLTARAHTARNNVMSGFGLIHGRLYIYLIYWSTDFESLRMACQWQNIKHNSGKNHIAEIDKIMMSSSELFQC